MRFLVAWSFCLLALPAAAESPEALKSREFAAQVPTVAISSAPAPLTVYFIDVGQGDAEFIELPNGKRALIDGGPSRKSLSKFLDEHGVTRIDYVVLTHPHRDHYDGFQCVFGHLPVDRFYDTKSDNSGAKGDEKIRAQAAEAGCRTDYPKAGDKLDWAPGVEVKVLSSCPEATASKKNNEINDCSIVLKLTYQGVSILFTGDIQEDVEKKLVAKYGDELGAQILKVPHHGSAYSSTLGFLDTVCPREAYIEVGAQNRYGHPDLAALERLSSVGAVVHRTDQEGTLSYAIGCVIPAPAK